VRKRGLFRPVRSPHSEFLQRRFAGLGIGFVAVTALLLNNASAGGTHWAWLLASLSLPALLAVHTVIMSSRQTSLSASAAVGMMMSLAAVLLLPFVLAFDELFMPWDATEAALSLVLVLALSTAAALVLAIMLVRSTGPVFSGQMAYSQTMGGVFWAYLLLDERLTPFAWAALAAVLAGVCLVAPCSRQHEFRATLRGPTRGTPA
jgi:drug/metabolite transporter (DMT)-like permease